MRVAFFKALQDSAQTCNDIYLLTADLGFKLFDEFGENHPERFFDIGIAESNMVGIAAGLSLSGKNVYCYSMIPFLVMRAYEQVRVDIAYHNLNVKLIGVGGGLAYGLEGFTHFAVEDFALMRALPNMTVVTPADAKEAAQLAQLSSDYPLPLYIRLGANGDPVLHASAPDIRIGKGMLLREGKDVAIFATGSMVYAAKQALDELAKRGLSATLINMHTLKPLDAQLIRQCAAAHEAIFTIEEHSTTGGLGSAVAEVLSESAYRGVFKRIGIPEHAISFTGKADYLRELCGLSSKAIATTIIKELQGKMVWAGR